MLVLCENPACQKPFNAKPYRRKLGKDRYCALSCYYACYVPRTLEERFWSKVDTTSTPDGCWLWTGSVYKKHGYGRLSLPVGEHRIQRFFPAHRIGYIIQYGPIPPGLWVLHKPPCVNRLCIRHLYLGTHQDNMKDMVSLGRAFNGADLHPESRARGEHHGTHTHPERIPRGEHHYNAKLPDTDVAMIRATYTGARGEQKALATQYHVSQALISMILNNKKRLPFVPPLS